MAKVADKYFKTDSWKVIEEGFNPDYGKVAESIFSLGNEYMGIRGYFEEGYSKDKLMGSYFNGVYERTKPEYGHYKGITDFSEYMVNSVNYLYTRIVADGVLLDLADADITDYVRELDMKSGLLTRSFVWNVSADKKVLVKFERVLSMTDVELAMQRITLTALSGDVDLKFTSGLDFGELHMMQKKNMWNCAKHEVEISDVITMKIEGETLNTDKKVYSACSLQCVANGNDSAFGDVYKAKTKIVDEKLVATEIEMKLAKDETVSFVKKVRNIAFKDGDSKEEYEASTKNVDIKVESFDEFVDTQRKWWDNVWMHSDIVIDGDEENQQGIRFCIFQMFQTYHGAVKGTNIGAKGLTGEAYNGNAFWDTETYCLPFFIFNNKEAAKNLLYFRYKTLDEARNRANALDCKGAFYPIATISGKECCDLWQHASLQLQASTGVAYGIWFYEKIFADKEFMSDYGLEMLIEISRMLVSRGDYAPDGKYGYYAVMGPDEFQMMVNNNCYTNYMGKFTLDYTVKKIEEAIETDSENFKKLASKIGYDSSEMDEFKKAAKDMFIPYHEDTKIFEQHDGFFKLPHLDVDAIPITDFPLYSNWSYDRIYRNDMIKQPDVLMFMLLFNSQFSDEQLRANYDFYEPKCIHESSLSPSVHSILAAQLHKEEEAYNFFGFATRMDLDNYNRNTGEGIHTTSIAAAWMNIVYGFGGLRTDGDCIKIAPSIPKDWNGYSFKINYDDETVEVTVSKDKVNLKTTGDKAVSMEVYGKMQNIDRNGYECQLE
ncbi:MAG: family 65 glycosyl hydrolase [Lachnospiraceae bacterium]|nr:family 65 glycosyl hydrolase [Lachnospiraceae bacterium]